MAMFSNTVPAGYAAIVHGLFISRLELQESGCAVAKVANKDKVEMELRIVFKILLLPADNTCTAMGNRCTTDRLWLFSALSSQVIDNRPHTDQCHQENGSVVDS